MCTSFMTQLTACCIKLALKKEKTVLVIEVLEYVVKEAISFGFKEPVGKIEHLTNILAAVCT